MVECTFDSTGTRIIADLRTATGKQLYRTRRPYHDPDFEVLQQSLQEGDVFVDGGANVGQFTLTAARLVGPTGCVLAFEPDPGTFTALAKNVKLNGFSHVDIRQYALAEHDSVEAFVSMGIASGLSSFAPADPRHGTTVHVEVRALDAVITPTLRRRVRLVKLDVEGAELRVLNGATRLIEEARPDFLVEVEDDHLRRQGASADELVGFFLTRGYDAFETPGASPNVLFKAR